MEIAIGSATDGGQVQVLRLALPEPGSDRPRTPVSVLGTLPIPDPLTLLAAPGRGLWWAGSSAGDGTVLTMHRTEDGLEILGSVTGVGGHPCHLALAPTRDNGSPTLWCATWGGGHASLLTLDRHGTPTDLRRLDPVADHAKTHHCEPLPDGRVLVTHLGADAVTLHSAAGALLSLSPLPAGTGPRSLARSGDHVWVSGERSSTVVRLTPKHRGYAVGSPTASTSRRLEVGSNHPAAVVICPDGRHLIVANRGHDTLGVLALDETDAPVLERELASAAWPTDLLDTGDHLLVACRDGDRIQAWSWRDVCAATTAEPEPTAYDIPCAAPISLAQLTTQSSPGSESTS